MKAHLENYLALSLKSILVYISIFIAVVIYSFATGNQQALLAVQTEYRDLLLIFSFVMAVIQHEGFFKFLLGLRKCKYVFLCASESTEHGKVKYTPIYSFKGNSIEDAPESSVIGCFDNLCKQDIFNNNLKIVTMDLRPSLSPFANSFKPLIF
jgi:hypothetical protein